MVWNFKPQMRAYRFVGHKVSVHIELLVAITTAATTTKNVRILVLPSYSCGSTLQSLYVKLFYSSIINKLLYKHLYSAWC